MADLALRIGKRLQQAMAEDESYTPTGILAGSMAFIMMLVPIAIIAAA